MAIPAPKPEVGDIMYRYFDSSDPWATGPYLEEFRVTRLTANDGFFVDAFGTEKYINRYWHKRYAHTTKEEAMASYIKRKERQIMLLSNQLDRAKQSLAAAISPEALIPTKPIFPFDLSE